MIESVEVEQVTVTSTAVDAVTVGVEVESVQVGVTGPQGPSGSGGATALVVQEGDSTVVAEADTVDFAAADFDVTVSPSGEANIAIASGIARDSEVTAAIAAHAGEADPHTGYLLESDAPELIRDTMGTALVAGSNVTITPNDGADTITIASTGGVTDHGALTGLSDDDHPQYVLNTGDTLTGGLLLTGTAATEAYRTLVTGETNNRFRVLADGQTRIIGRDAAIPTYTGVNRPMVYIEALGGQSSTALIIRGSSDTTTGNQIFRAEDYLGAPIAWLAYAGGFRITDAMAAVNGVFTVTEQAGFFFRNTNGSGAILSNLDTLSLVFGVSSRVWSGDLVGSGKTLGLNISRSSWSFVGSITSGSATVTVVSGLPDARAVPIGSVLQGITGIPNGTTVTATTQTTLTLSANATATNGSLTVRIYEPDTLAIRAYNGVEIHGKLTGSDTAAGKILFDDGLILSGDNDSDGWRISRNDKNLLPPTSGVGGEIGSTSNRLRRLWVDLLRVNTSIIPRSGQSVVIGDTTDPIAQLVVNDIQGTVNDGWTLAPTAWTRVSDTQFTISSATDFTSRYQKGTRLKWVDSGGTKYGVVASSSFASSTTTVNLIPTSDFVMASSPATGSRWYSHQMRPQGFPYTFNCTTTHTGFSADPAYYAKWDVEGNKITFHYRCTANGTSNSTAYTVTAPVAATSSPATYFDGATCLLTVDNSTILTTVLAGGPKGPGRATITSGVSTVTIYSDMGLGGWTASGGKRVIFTMTYEF